MSLLAWKRSATGNWVATASGCRFSINSLVCFQGRRSCRRYRLRVNESAVGGARPNLFASVSAAKKHAQTLVDGNCGKD
jgi:hypothetical protein